MGKLPNWTAPRSFETYFLDFKSFHICLKLDFMWLQPILNFSVSHEIRLAWPRPLLSFPLTFLALRAHCCLLLNLVSPGPFLQSWFSAGWPLAVNWGPELFYPGAEVCISSCWTSQCCCQPISLACQGPSVWQHNCLVPQPLLCVPSEKLLTILSAPSLK